MKVVGDCVVIGPMCPGDDWDAEIITVGTGSRDEDFRLRWRDGRVTSLAEI